MPQPPSYQLPTLGSVQSQIMRLEDLKAMAIASEDYERASRIKVCEVEFVARFNWLTGIVVVRTRSIKYGMIRNQSQGRARGKGRR